MYWITFLHKIRSWSTKMRKKISRSFLIWQLLYIYQSVSPSEFHHIWCVITFSRWNRTFGNIIGTLNIFIYSTPQNTAKAKGTLSRGKNINDNHYITSFNYHIITLFELYASNSNAEQNFHSIFICIWVDIPWKKIGENSSE